MELKPQKGYVKWTKNKIKWIKDSLFITNCFYDRTKILTPPNIETIFRPVIENLTLLRIRKWGNDEKRQWINKDHSR